MSVINFDSENLKVDWISFNLEGLMDPGIIAHRLWKYFTPHVLIDDVPNIGFHGFKKKYKVSIRQYTGSKGYWVGTKIIFSGKNAAYFYKLLKTQRFDWRLLKFDQKTLSLGRIDLCFSRPNDWSHTSKSLKALYLDQNVENDTQEVNLIELKTGSGTVLTVRKRQNQTSEASKSALKICGGFRFSVVSIIDRSSRLEEYAKDCNEKYPAEMQKLRDDLGSGNFKSGRGSRKMPGSKTIYYMRSGQKVRLYYRYSKTEERTIEIVAETSKANQPKTIKLLKKMYK